MAVTWVTWREEMGPPSPGTQCCPTATLSSIYSKKYLRPGTVALACNPSGDQENHSLRLSQGKKFARPHLNQSAEHGGTCLSSQL
jgi:hypothetical protein